MGSNSDDDVQHLLDLLKSDEEAKPLTNEERFLAHIRLTPSTDNGDWVRYRYIYWRYLEWWYENDIPGEPLERSWFSRKYLTHLEKSYYMSEGAFYKVKGKDDIFKFTDEEKRKMDMHLRDEWQKRKGIKQYPTKRHALNKIHSERMKKIWEKRRREREEKKTTS